MYFLCLVLVFVHEILYKWRKISSLMKKTPDFYKYYFFNYTDKLIYHTHIMVYNLLYYYYYYFILFA